MANKRAEILTPWAEYDEDGMLFRAPLVTLEYQTKRFTDITGQPAENIMPDPNVFSALIECDEAVLAEIEADDRFYVVWEEYT